MKTMHDVVKHELVKLFPPGENLTPQQMRAYFKKLDRASLQIIRAIRYFVDFDGGDGNGHG